MRERNIAAGLVLAVLGILVMQSGRRLSYQDEFGPGPGFLPYWLGLVLTGLALCLVASAVRSRAYLFKPDTAGRSASRALLVVAGMFAMVAVLERLGFVVSFALFSFFMVYVVQRRSFAGALTVAAALTFGFFLLFRVVLPLPLPVGAWGF